MIRLYPFLELKSVLQWQTINKVIYFDMYQLNFVQTSIYIAQIGARLDSVLSNARHIYCNVKLEFARYFYHCQ